MMPFAAQLANIAPYVADAARHVCPDDVDPDEVARLAIERFSSIGALEHGDAMFHLTPDQLVDEEVAEYADAIIYRARRMALTDQRGFVTTLQPLTAEEIERLRANVRAALAGGAGPVLIPPDYLATSASTFRKAMARFGRAVRLANERRSREMQGTVVRVPRAGSAEDPSCFTMRAPCVADTPAGYDEDNRAEALHSTEGDA